jgi:hypothetical protein
VAAFAVIGCATRSPDVVVMKTKAASSADGSTIKSPPVFEPCRAGHYKGFMNSIPDPNGWPVQFTGDIEFSLVESLSGEFVVLKDYSNLNGTGANGATFSAMIPGGNSCVDGSFHTKLEMGEYRLTKDTAPIRFEGSIDGTYNAKFTAFTGNWTSSLHLSAENDASVLVVNGLWAATWLSE